MDDCGARIWRCNCGEEFDSYDKRVTHDSTCAQGAIMLECDELKELLLEKNRSYGNSATDPVRIFSKCSAEEQLNVRIDDKLSRILRGQAAGEDVEKDLIGYLIMKRVQRRLAGAK